MFSSRLGAPLGRPECLLHYFLLPKKFLYLVIIRAEVNCTSGSSGSRRGERKVNKFPSETVSLFHLYSNI